MARLATCLMLGLWPFAACRAGGDGWGCVFVVAGNCRAPTATRRGLDAVAHQARQLPDTPAFRVAVIHDPAGVGGPVLAVRGHTTRLPQKGWPPSGPPPASVKAALATCAAPRRAVVFVGHSSDLGGEPADRLGMAHALAIAREWVQQSGGRPIDLMVLHACHSARVETLLRLDSLARWVVASPGWIQPDALDYRVLCRPGPMADGRAAARRLTVEVATRARRAQPVLSLVSLPKGGGPRFAGAFGRFANALDESLRQGAVAPSEIGDLCVPYSRPGQVDLASLLQYAAAAQWLPHTVRSRAREALSTLTPLVAGEGPVTVDFPWGHAARDNARPGTESGPLAVASGWPELVRTAASRAAEPAARFLGWEFERRLVGVSN